MDKKFKCPNCNRSSYVKNGYSGRGSNQKQKYKCKYCGKTFVERNETLSRSEKRLLSLLFNLINYKVDERTSLKSLSSACKKEIPKIRNLTLKVEKSDINLNEIDNIIMVVCQKQDDIQIIKTYPEEITLTISDLASHYKEYMDKFLNG